MRRLIAVGKEIIATILILSGCILTEVIGLKALQNPPISIYDVWVTGTVGTMTVYVCYLYNK